MAFLDRFRTPIAETAEPMVPRAALAAVSNELEMVHESLAGLEQLAREDVGWRKIGTEQEQSFTRAGLLTIQTTCLAAAIKSPLLGRGLRIRRNYVWGQGVEIAARDVTTDGAGSTVNDLVQGFIDSPEFARTLGTAQAREEREVDLGVRGEFFLLAIHDTASRSVRPRLIPGAQVTDYIANPDDRSEVWFYQRQWTTSGVDLYTGEQRTVTRTEWHPVLDYRPPLRARMDLINGQPVRWDQPIQHCAVNSWTESPYGIPDIYPALDWARAYADYLGQWASLMRALAKYAFKVTAPAKQAPRVRAALQNGAGPDPLTGNAPTAGTAVMSPDATMAPMHSSGATIDASSGKPLAGMAAAALDVPITMLLADPGISGARATAETLDRPLELAIMARQQLWADWLKALFDHVITVAVGDGLIAGTITQGPTRQLAVLPEAVDATVDVTFPPVAEQSVTERLTAIVQADSLGTLPPLLIVRMALEALGVEDIDEVLDELTDDDGNFTDPRLAQAAAAVQREQNGAPGSQAEEAYR